jgi:SNF2 family DNA or RNA helicase
MDLIERIKLIGNEIREMPSKDFLADLGRKDLLDEIEKEHGSLDEFYEKFGKDIESSYKGTLKEFPSKHQWRGIEKIAEDKRVLIMDEMGTGKTAQAILAKFYIEEKLNGSAEIKEAILKYLDNPGNAKFSDFAKENYQNIYKRFGNELESLTSDDLITELNPNIDKANKKLQGKLPGKKLKTLIIAPNTAKENWKSEIEKYIPGYGKNIELINSHNKEESLKRIKEENKDVVIINYDLIFRSNWDIKHLDEYEHDSKRMNEILGKFKDNPKAEERILDEIRIMAKNGRKYNEIAKILGKYSGEEKLRKSAEMLSKLEQLTEAKSIVGQLSELGFDYVIADEVHHARNPSALRSRALQKIIKNAEYAVMLTGEPISRGVEDLGVIAHCLFPEINPKEFSFNCKNDPLAVHNFISTHALRRTLNDLKDMKIAKLKEKGTDESGLELEQMFELEGDYKDAYQRIKNSREIHPIIKLGLLRKLLINPYLISPEFMNSRIRILEEKLDKCNGEREDVVAEIKKLESQHGQIRYIFRNDKELLNKLSSMEPVKYSYVNKIVNACLGRDEKIVIFSSLYKEGVTEDLEKRLKEKYRDIIVRIDGDVSTESNGKMSERRRRILDFQTNPGKKIMIATIQTMSECVNLTSGNNMIFLDKPYTSLDVDQAIKREQRLRQKKEYVNVYSLIAKKTVDEGVESLLNQRRGVIDLFLNYGVLKRKEDRQLLENKIEAYKQKPIADCLKPDNEFIEVDEKKAKKESKLKTPTQRFNNLLEPIFKLRYMDEKKNDGKNRQGKYIKKHGGDIAQWYHEDIFYRYQTNLHRLQSQILTDLQNENLIKLGDISDHGSAGGFFAFEIGQPTYNIDRIPEMFTIGRERIKEQIKELISKETNNEKKADLEKRFDAFEKSKNIVSELEHIKELKPETMDFALCDLVIQWNSLEKRIEIFKEINRVLKKNDGYFSIGLHKDLIKPEGENKLYAGMTELGFKPLYDISGYAKAIYPQCDFKTFIAFFKKINEPNAKINKNNFDFISRAPYSRGDGLKTVINKAYGEPEKVICERFSFYEPIANTEKAEIHEATKDYARKIKTAETTRLNDDRLIVLDKNDSKYHLLDRIEDKIPYISQNGIRLKTDLCNIVKSGRNGGIPAGLLNKVIDKINEYHPKLDDSRLKKELREIRNYSRYIKDL